MGSANILSVDAREIRSRPAPKASVGRKELTAWSGAASTWMVCVRALGARLTNNGKKASSLCRQHQVVFGLATVAFISALSRVALRRESNCAARANISALDSLAWRRRRDFLPAD